MECIKLHVKKLGRIKDSNIEIFPLSLFYGESGLGKSYLAMLVHYFYEIMIDKSYRFTTLFLSKGFDYTKQLPKFRNEGVAIELLKKDIESFLAEDCLRYLKYMLNNDQLSGELSISLPDSVPDVLTFKYKEELRGLVGAEDVYILLSCENIGFRVSDKDIGTSPVDKNLSPFAFLLGIVLLEKIFDKNKMATFCLPPSRGPVMTEDVHPITGLYKEFILQKKTLESADERTDDVSSELINLFGSVLDGDVVREDGKYLYKTHGSVMPLSAAAASIRELAALSFIARKRSLKNSSILFEEPEAHLHPLKQRLVADIVSAFIHEGAALQVTTHSDYFIRRINELILLHRLEIKNRNNFYAYCRDSGVNADLALDPEKIGSYLLEENADGSVSVDRQDLSDGVPFSSFKKSISDSFKAQNALENLLEDNFD